MRFLVASVLILAVVACGGESWPKKAGDTSCAEWIDEMSKDQREGLARGMLTALWNGDGAASEPGDDVVLKFANAVGGTCAAWREEKVAKVAGSLYVLSDDVKP